MKNMYGILPLIMILFCVACSSSDDDNPQSEALSWVKVSTLWSWGLQPTLEPWHASGPEAPFIIPCPQ